MLNPMHSDDTTTTADTERDARRARIQALVAAAPRFTADQRAELRPLVANLGDGQDTERAVS